MSEQSNEFKHAQSAAVHSSIDSGSTPMSAGAINSREIMIAEAVRNECLSLMGSDAALHDIRRMDIQALIASLGDLPVDPTSLRFGESTIPQPFIGAITLLETFAEVGMEPLDQNGGPSPNKLLCLRIAKEMAAACSYLQQAPVAWRARQYDNVEKEHSEVWVLTSDPIAAEMYMNNGAVVEGLMACPVSEIVRPTNQADVSDTKKADGVLTASSKLACINISLPIKLMHEALVFAQSRNLGFEEAVHQLLQSEFDKFSVLLLRQNAGRTFSQMHELYVANHGGDEAKVVVAISRGLEVRMRTVCKEYKFDSPLLAAVLLSNALVNARRN